MHCSVLNCNSKLYARGWCRRHYRHVVEGGNAAPHPVKDVFCACGGKRSMRSGTSDLCRKCYYKKWMMDNKQQQDQYGRQYRSENKDKIANQVRQWHVKNRDRTSAYYAKKRQDPHYRLAHNLRSRLYDVLKGKIKHKNTKELVGCSWEDLIKHIECQFKDGMSWDNYGTYWSVDHIEPYSAIDINDKIGIERVSNYRNLRPLTIEENCSKASKDKKWKSKNS